MNQDDTRSLWAAVWARWLPILLAFEGLYLKPYLCPAGVWTIALGLTFYPDGRPVRPTDPPLTRQQAIDMSEQVAMRFFLQVLPLVRLQTVGQHVAVVDFCFNVGINAFRRSTLRRRIMAGQYELVPQEFRRWTKAGGRVLRGLERRAETRVAEFTSGEAPTE